MERTFKYYTKVKIDASELFFDNFEKLQAFMDLYFNSNQNNQYIKIAQSDNMEYFENVGE